MKKGLTELVFIIDRSGSMGGLENDTIGGFNAMLKEQQSVDGEATVTTVLFDDQYELFHDRIDIKAIAPLTSEDYTVRGNTALLDAVGKTIKKIREVQKRTAEDYRAEKVMFTIITDGEENASREYSAERIKKRIEHQKKKYGWEFIFIGANMDAVKEAGKLGIAANRAQNYNANSAGTATAYSSITAASTAYRTGKGLGRWADSVKSNLTNVSDSEPTDSSYASKEDAKNAFANLKKAFGGLTNVANDLADVMNDVQACNGVPDANDILRGILAEELENLETNDGDKTRIDELRMILKR
jgi:uncharacterized protein YegL